MVKNPHSQCMGMGQIPGWGTKIPSTAKKLNLCMATIESVHSRACVGQVEKAHVLQLRALCYNKDPARPKKKKRLSVEVVSIL